jgi:hypothetical protein
MVLYATFLWRKLSHGNHLEPGFGRTQTRGGIKPVIDITTPSPDFCCCHSFVIFTVCQCLVILLIIIIFNGLI